MTLPIINPLSAKFIKWSNTLKQIVGKLPTICLSVFDHFSGLAFKGLMIIYIQYLTLQKKEISRGTTKSKDRNYLLYIIYYIIYYANTSATFNLIISGDIEINLRPGFSASKCTVCGNVVKINNKRLICSTCFDAIHAKCSKQPSYHTIQARIPRYYICNRCLHMQLPFFNISNLDSSYDMGNTANDNRLSIQNTISNITNSNKTISIAHLNTQAICSTFDEFTCMLNTQKFDIMTLSETWLKDNPHLLDYVKIDGYEVKFRNREHTRGGGVGLYIRSDIKYKLRNDILNTNTDIEHLWLEVTLRNKNSVYFISQTLIISPNQYGWTSLMTFYPMHAPDGATQLLFADI